MLVSVVIVTCNRKDELLKNLSALENQTRKNFEVIVVDNGQDEVGLAANTQNRPFEICYVKLRENLGPAFGRNTAVKFAKGEYIAFIDDDSVPDNDWVEKILDNFKRHQMCGLRGRISTRKEQKDVPDYYDLGPNSIPSMCEVPGNSAFRKDIFVKLGGFDTNLFVHEGVALSYEIYKLFDDSPRGVMYAPDVHVQHQPCDENSVHYIDIETRQEVLQRLTTRRWEMKPYVQCMRVLYPGYEGGFDEDYPNVLGISLILEKDFPHLALSWARKALQLEPGSVKVCYVLGSSLLRMGRYAEAVTFLERAVPVLACNVFDKPVGRDEEELDRYNETLGCYISTCTKLAQCYMNQAEYGKVKTVYTHLLSNPHLQLTPAQRGNFESVLAKFQNVQAVAIGDGMENVPAEAFEKDAARGISGTDGAGSSDVSDAQMNGQYLVSAIVSTYNSERFLRGCLDDLQRQSIADKLEIIVVNSGSEQNEEAIVREYQQRYNNIVYIRTEKREGIYSAWNRAVKVARGEFLTNANADDRHRADALEVMAKTLQANLEIALVYGDCLVTETANATFEQPCAVEVANLPNYSRETLLSKSCIGSQPMWRKSVHDEFGYFDDTLTRAGDWDFWIRISGKYDFKHIPEILGVVYHNENDIEYCQKVHSPYERYIVGKRYGTEYLAGIAYYKGDDGPLVSVIMAAHNAENCITEVIESVLIQNYRKFELLVVDTGSTDRTRQIVLGFKDEKLRYLYKKNAGLAGAVNEGIRKSRGDYVIKLDPEDILLPEFVVSGLKKFNEYPDTDVVYCDGGVIGPDGKQAQAISQDGDEDSTNLVRDLFRYGSPIVPFRTCVRKAVFEKVGLYDEQLAVAEDYDMICRFAKAGLKAHHLKGPLYLRRMHPDSLCRTSTTEKAKAHISVIKRIIDTFSPDELFPDIDWSRIPQDKIAQHAGCLIGATLIAIAKNYQTTNEPINAGLALQQARTALNECLKIDPGHSQARGLLRDCELLCRALGRTGPAFSEAGKPDRSKVVSVS